MIDKAKSLQELDSEDWGEPVYTSHLVTTCHALRKKPIKDFTIEDVRIMIGQRLSLNILMPIGLDILEDNPFAEGDFYPGDLLKTVISGPESGFWQEHADQARRLDAIVTRAMDRLPTLEESDQKCLKDALNGVSSQIDHIKRTANQGVHGSLASSAP